MPTLQDIATEVGVSVNTVSRVLNGNHKSVYPRVEARAENIRRTAERMGYRPNTAAQSTRTGRFNCVALVSPMSRGGFLPPTLLVGLDMAMRERNLHLSISDLPHKVSLDGDLGPKLLRELLADGLLINYDPAGMPADLVKRIDDDQIPSIWINMDRSADCVGPDDRHGGAWAARELISRGSKRLCMVTPSREGNHISVRDRREGFVEEAKSAGLTVQIIEQNDADARATEQLRELMDCFSADNRPDGVFTYEAEEAGRVLMAAASAGLNVPDDLQVIATTSGHKNSTGLPVATLMIPFGEIGVEAIDLLYARIDSPGKPLPPRVIPYRHFVEGATLRRPCS